LRARPGTGPQHRRAAGQITEHGHRHDPLRAGDQISPDDVGADPGGFVPHSVGQRVDLCGSGFGWRTEADDERGDARPHRFDIGGVLRHGFPADVMWCRPVQPKVPALDQHVRRHHHAAIGGHHHRAVITGPEGDVG